MLSDGLLYKNKKIYFCSPIFSCSSTRKKSYVAHMNFHKCVLTIPFAFLKWMRLNLSLIKMTQSESGKQAGKGKSFVLLTDNLSLFGLLFYFFSSLSLIFLGMFLIPEELKYSYDIRILDNFFRKILYFSYCNFLGYLSFSTSNFVVRHSLHLTSFLCSFLTRKNRK